MKPGFEPLTRITSSPEETEALGGELAKALCPGDVVLLAGDLGAGKSVLARGIVHSLPGGGELPVRSPTFVYLCHYPTDPPVHHADLYRLPGGSDPFELGLEDCLEEGGVLLIEWPQALGSARFANPVIVRIELLGGQRRRITIECS